VLVSNVIIAQPAQNTWSTLLTPARDRLPRSAWLTIC